MTWTAQQLDYSMLSNLQLEVRDDPQTSGYRWNALRDRQKHRPAIEPDEMRRHLEAIAKNLD